MSHLRDLGAERRWIRHELKAIELLIVSALYVDGALLSTPRTRRAQTLKIKVAARRLSGLHLSILCGKGRSK